MQKTNSPRSRQRTNPGRTLELPPDRAFVIHLDARAHPPRRIVGRVEHVTSGRVTHVSTLRELMNFLSDVLRDKGRD
jgi:hypothetical protein